LPIYGRVISFQLKQDAKINQSSAQKAAMNSAEIYRAEIFTDRRVDAIKHLTPVSAEGQ